MPPVNRNGWRPSCSHATLRAIRYRALLHGWAFCPYRAMLMRMATESGIETPSAEDLARFDKQARGQDAVERGLEEPDRPPMRPKERCVELPSAGIVAVRWLRSRRRAGGGPLQPHRHKLNDVDPQAWLADVLARIADHPVHRLDELMPWNWAAERERRKLAA